MSLRICPICQGEFEAISRRRYCSRSCKQVANADEAKNYRSIHGEEVNRRRRTKYAIERRSAMGVTFPSEFRQDTDGPADDGVERLAASTLPPAAGLVLSVHRRNSQDGRRAASPLPVRGLRLRPQVAAVTRTTRPNRLRLAGMSQAWLNVSIIATPGLLAP